METINNELTNWLQHLGVAEEYVMVVLRIGIILAILIVASAMNRICKKIIIPVALCKILILFTVQSFHLPIDDLFGLSR
jgi:hypothetical protein